MERLMKQCKLCPNVTEDARYVAAIQGWRCGECDTVHTGRFTVQDFEQKTRVDHDPGHDPVFIVESREILDDRLTQGLRTTIRMHRAHLDSL